MDYDDSIGESGETGIERSVTMCCGGKKCPVLKLDGAWITITDDYGQTVKIPRMHKQAFVAAVHELFDVVT